MVEHKLFGFFMIIIMILSLGALIWAGYYIVSISKQTNSACSMYIKPIDIQTCCNNWARDNNIGIPECLGEWKIRNNTCHYECGVTIPSVPKLPPMPAGIEKDCEGVSLNKVESCCSAWAEKNNVVNPDCLGKWEIQAGWCMWQCSE